jgi:two-component system sensor histidine kinase PilS (NtrC family)
MRINFESVLNSTHPSSWRELRLFSWYRLILTILLVCAFYLKYPTSFLGESHPNFYINVVISYVVIALGFLFFTAKKWGPFQLQVLTQITIDLVIIIILIHASGGLKTGLGSLMVVVVVVAGALIPGRMAIFISAIATLMILLQAIYSQFIKISVSDYSQAGMLGATLFITALLSQTLSKKILENQKLAEQRQQDVKKMAMLNEHIISRMQTGVIVVSPSGQIRLNNQAVLKMLGMNQDKGHQHEVLSQWCPQLAKQLSSWKQHLPHSFEPFQAKSELPQVLASAMKLESGDFVLYVENTTATAQQVQQLKLASLGRLTASIAHEIRNPLGAISHAGELLAETNQDDRQVRKLTDIIDRHTSRVNKIIDTILEMSRRKKVNPQVVVLETWLIQFVDEFSEHNGIDKNKIKVSTLSPLATVLLDPEQLYQIILNLVENAWHYSTDDDNMPRVEIKLSRVKTDVHVDISDNGPGVSDSTLPQLFEPFCSERTGGTGLGLYLARELAQANGAWLNYVPEESGKSRFRMVIPMKNRENLE